MHCIFCFLTDFSRFDLSFIFVSLFSSWIEDSSVDVDCLIERDVYNGSDVSIDIDSLIEIVKYHETLLIVNDWSMTGVFIVDSYYILYQSSTANEYSSSVCNDYSNDVFNTGKVYSFSNTLTFSWTYGSSTYDVSASKIISLEATTPPSNGKCFVSANDHDENAFELVSLFNVSCVNWETSYENNSDLQYNFLVSNQDSSYFLKSSYDEIPFIATRLSQSVDTISGVIVDSVTGAATCYDINNITVNALDIKNYTQISDICNDTFKEANDNDENVVLAVEICYEILNETANNGYGNESSDAQAAIATITGEIQESLIFVFLNAANNFSSYENAAQLLSILATITHPIPAPNDYIYSDKMISSVLEFIESALNYLTSIVDQDTPLGSDVAQSVVGMSIAIFIYYVFSLSMSLFFVFF